MLYRSFEEIAHSLRVLLEFHWKNMKLFEIDIEEGVGNMRMGSTSVLNAYHNLYDAMQKSNVKFDWYANPETAVLLLLRNARHHNHCNGIRDQYSHHLMNTVTPDEFRKYKFIDFIPNEEAFSYTYYLSWGDFKTFLELPQKVTRIRINTRELVYDYLNVDKMDELIEGYGYSYDNIFFNLIPLLINGFRVLYRELAAVINFDEYNHSTEVQALIITADEESLFDTKEHIVEFCEWSF